MGLAKKDASVGDPPARKPAKTAARGAERRDDERYDFRRGGVPISIEHPGGGFTKINAFLRNVSAGGMAFLSKGYVHPGSACNITLVRKDGRSKLVNGQITSCRYLQDSTHEVGIKFDNRIEPSMLLDVSGSDGRTIELPDLKGRVLVVDDSKMDQILLAHHMKGSGAEIKNADSREAAAKMLGEETFDIVICDPSMGGQADAGALVAAIRAAGFMGPIVACTAENSAEKLAAGKAAGATHTLMKPYEQKDLHDLLIALHREVGAVLTARAIYSTLDDDSTLEQGLAEFVSFARQCAEQIDTAMRKNDGPAARAVCLNLKGSSIGFGFASIGEAAREAADGLDAGGGKMEGARAQVRYLGLMCRAVALRGKAE